MAVKLRLTRFGAKKRPYYRIVVADSRSRRDGRFLEQIGTYDPKVDPPRVTLKAGRIRHWLAQGARPTDTVKALLRKHLRRAEQAEQEAARAAAAKASAAESTAAEPAPAEPPTASEAVSEAPGGAAGDEAAPAAEDAASADTPTAQA